MTIRSISSVIGSTFGLAAGSAVIIVGLLHLVEGSLTSIL